MNFLFDSRCFEHCITFQRFEVPAATNYAKLVIDLKAMFGTGGGSDVWDVDPC